MEKHEENARAQSDPGDCVKHGLNGAPAQRYADRAPNDQAVVFAKHQEEHAGADLPSGYPIPAVEIEGDGAFTDLLVHQRENVGAGANRQNIRVTDFGVVMTKHTPDDQAVEDKIKETVRNHQSEPATPTDVFKALQEIRKQRAALGGGGMVETVV